MATTEITTPTGTPPLERSGELALAECRAVIAAEEALDDGRLARRPDPLRRRA